MPSFKKIVTGIRSLFRSKPASRDYGNEPEEADKAQRWLAYALDQPGLNYEFAFGLSVVQKYGGWAPFPRAVEWPTAHTKAYLSVYNSGNFYLGSVMMDLVVNGFQMRLSNLDLDRPNTWTDGHYGANAIHAYWYHPISRKRAAMVGSEALRSFVSGSTYRNLLVLPGVGNQGHNCSTYAVSLADKAGFNFWSEKIFGANPVHLDNVLRMRRGWKCKWR